MDSNIEKVIENATCHQRWRIVCIALTVGHYDLNPHKACPCFDSDARRSNSDFED